MHKLMELFVVGQFGFYALIVAFIVLEFAFTACDVGVGAFLSFVAFVIGLQFLSKIDVFGFALSHPHWIVGFVVAYLLLGTMWATKKWRMLVFKELQPYDDLFADFLRKHELPADTKVLPVEYRKAWKNLLSEYPNRNIPTTPPLVKDHKEDITRWMSLWVFSFIIYIGQDFIVGIFNNIYYSIAGFLQRMSDSIYNSRNIKENLNVPE